MAVKEVLCQPDVLRALLLHSRQWVCGSVAFLVLAHSTEQAAAVFALAHRRCSRYRTGACGNPNGAAPWTGTPSACCYLA